ncbi:MAG TPA: arylesterase [Novosphingobium sp.]|nr:arylesterase [Novosphingobium sp.]
MKLYWPAVLGSMCGALVLAGCGSGERDAAVPGAASTEQGPPELPVMGPEVRVLAIGDSLLTGYGLDDGKSYPAMLERALRARGVNARIANAGVSGDTSAAGMQRLDFTLNSQQRPPDLVVISLGGNDMLRGIAPDQTRANLEAMLETLRGKKIPVLLLGMLAAPNLGKDYAGKFNPIYPELARKYDAALVPFFLQPLFDKPDLVQKDHIHPTEAGIEAMVAATVDDVAGALPGAR